MVIPIGDYHPTKNTPWVTYALILANVLFYLIQISQGQSFTNSHSVTPYELTNGRDLSGPPHLLKALLPDGNTLVIPMEKAPEEVYFDPAFEHHPTKLPVWSTLLTAMFMHGSPLHLLGNMLFLWIFGDNVEETFGWFGYLLLYLTAGVVGFLIQAMASPDSMIPILGASGAVAGIMGAYLILYPMNPIRVIIFYFPTDLPAFLVIGFWIASQFTLGLYELDRLGKTGGVAYLAHIGGVSAGIAATYLVIPIGARRLQPSPQRTPPEF